MSLLQNVVLHHSQYDKGQVKQYGSVIKTHNNIQTIDNNSLINSGDIESLDYDKIILGPMVTDDQMP